MIYLIFFYFAWNIVQTKGSDIRFLIANIRDTHGNLPELDRNDIDNKVESLNTQWHELKNAIERRIDLAELFVRFLQQSERLSKLFQNIETLLQSTPDDNKLAQFKIHWEQIKPAYAELKKDGNQFITDAIKVSICL